MATGENATRHRILTFLLHEGSATASTISDELELTATGIRRHLDNLLDAGQIEEHMSPSTGRGRPARQFTLSRTGRDYFGHTYDDLAVAALHALRAAGGEDAVAQFAQSQVEAILGDAGRNCSTPHEAADELARALNAHGFQATVTADSDGVTICRHHCPILDAAQQFPEFCCAEHDAVSDRLGVSAPMSQRSHDDGAGCTTFIPLTELRTTIKPQPASSNRRSLAPKATVTVASGEHRRVNPQGEDL